MKRENNKKDEERYINTKKCWYLNRIETKYEGVQYIVS